MVLLLWGQNCCFAHGKDELKKKTYLNSNYKSKICKHYHKNGVCPYGYRCQYFHIRDNESHSHLLTAFCEKIDIFIHKKNITLLDVRTSEEVKLASLGGINIPLNELSLPHKIGSLEQNKHIVIYCHHGVRSLSALKILQAHGFNHVQHLKGGIDAWSDIIDSNIKKY